MRLVTAYSLQCLAPSRTKASRVSWENLDGDFAVSTSFVTAVSMCVTNPLFVRTFRDRLCLRYHHTVLSGRSEGVRDMDQALHLLVLVISRGLLLHFPPGFLRTKL